MHEIPGPDHGEPAAFATAQDAKPFGSLAPFDEAEALPGCSRAGVRMIRRHAERLPLPPERISGKSWQGSGRGGVIWKQWRPAAVTSEPPSRTVSTGYLILNVTTGHIKRHAGGYVWEVPGA